VGSQVDPRWVGAEAGAGVVVLVIITEAGGGGGGGAAARETRSGFSHGAFTGAVQGVHVAQGSWTCFGAGSLGCGPQPESEGFSKSQGYRENLCDAEASSASEGCCRWGDGGSLQQGAGARKEKEELRKGQAEDEEDD